MTVKAWARRALASGPLYSVLQRRASTGPGALLLTYHTLGADDEDFDAWTVLRRSDFLRQIELLRRDHDVVSIDEALTGATPHADARPRVVLTFDDGHTGWFEHLLPIVEREALPVTLYVATSHIETGEPYWFDRVMNALQVEAPVTVNLERVGLAAATFDASRGVAHWQRISALLEALKPCSESQRDQAVAIVEQSVASVPARRFRKLEPMSVDQLRALAASAHVTIGAHSDDHRLLDRITLDQARASLERCRFKLQSWTGCTVRHFAFPNGNHNAELSRLAAQLGFASAATTRAGRWRPGDDAYALPRVFVGRYDDIDRFKLSLVGL